MKNPWTIALVALVVVIVIYYVWTAYSSKSTSTDPAKTPSPGASTAARMAMPVKFGGLNGQWCDCTDKNGQKFQCLNKNGDGSCSCCNAFAAQKIDLAPAGATFGFSAIKSL